MKNTDRYYTPQAIALRLAQHITLDTVSSIVDSNCGTGNLLSAAASRFPRASCLGIDVDYMAIRKLSHSHPNWTLLTGDSLQNDVWSKSGRNCADVAILNPPFTMAPRRVINSTFIGKTIRSSTAIAHLLTVIEQKSPKQIVAILPESWAHSGLDSCARAELARHYDCEIIEPLARTTFKGVFPNSMMVRLARQSESRIVSEVPLAHRLLHYQLIRGGLPVFEARYDPDGVPYLHTTDLVKANSIQSLKKVEPLKRGLVSGAALYLPRVGKPTHRSIKLLCFETPVQLSDCVIAVQSTSVDELPRLEKRIKDDWCSFEEIYTGTGARYTTVHRIYDWIDRVLV